MLPPSGSVTLHTCDFWRVKWTLNSYLSPSGSSSSEQCDHTAALAIHSVQSSTTQVSGGGFKALILNTCHLKLSCRETPAADALKWLKIWEFNWSCLLAAFELVCTHECTFWCEVRAHKNLKNKLLMQLSHKAHNARASFCCAAAAMLLYFLTLYRLQPILNPKLVALAEFLPVRGVYSLINWMIRWIYGRYVDCRQWLWLCCVLFASSRPAVAPSGCFLFYLSFKEDLHEAELLCFFFLNILGDLFKGCNLVIGIINWLNSVSSVFSLGVSTNTRTVSGSAQFEHWSRHFDSVEGSLTHELNTGP